MKVYYCDQHEIPLPEGHKFPLRKYRLLREALEGVVDFEAAQLADVETIKLAHDRDYVDRFVSGTIDPKAMRRIGFPWSEGLVRRTLASAGGTLAATRVALEHGIGGTLAGGTHHAFRAEGSGFCVFNDVAIAIHEMRAREGRRRVAVVDLDVHQGDGTAHFFENDPEVFTLSLHGKNNFPFRKQRSRLDVELADGTEDAEYLETLERALRCVWEFGPEIVFYLSGVDALKSDVLGRLSLTYDGLRARDQQVMGNARKRLIPLVITLGGGYAKPIEDTVRAHANTFRVAATLEIVP